MPKGITPVVAVILLLLITISIVGFSMLFFQRTAQTAGEAGEEQLQQQLAAAAEQFYVVSTDKNKVYIRNSGMSPLSNLNFFADGVKVDTTGPASITPGTIAEFTLNPQQMPISDSIALKVTSVGSSATETLAFANLASNPGFESGSNGWGTAGSVAVSSAQARNGTYSMALTKAGLATYPSLYKNVDAIPAWQDGKTIKFTIWAKGSATIDIAFEFWIEDGYLSCGPHRFGHQGVTTAWQKYEVVHTLSSSHMETCPGIPPQANELHPQMKVGVGRNYAASDSETVYFDDAFIAEVYP